MRRVVLWGVPIRMHPTLPLMAVLAVMLDKSWGVLIAALSLALHEISHVIAARRMRLTVLELELMPFGGAARIDGLWSLRPGQLLTISLAGPFCNLLIVLIAAALGWWGLFSLQTAGQVIEVNLALMLFNLIPALPLDGGRILSGLLSARMGPERAVRVGIWAGRALGAALIASAVAVYFATRQINIVWLLCAVYLIACAEREREGASAASLRSMIDRQAEMAGDLAMPMRWLAISKDASVADAVRAMRPRYMHMLAVYDGLNYMGNVDERRVLTGMMEDPNGTIGTLLKQKQNGTARSAGGETRGALSLWQGF